MVFMMSIVRISQVHCLKKCSVSLNVVESDKIQLQQCFEWVRMETTSNRWPQRTGYLTSYPRTKWHKYVYFISETYE